MSEKNLEETRKEAIKLGTVYRAMPQCYEHGTEYGLTENHDSAIGVSENIWRTGTVLQMGCHACGTVCFFIQVVTQC